MNVVAWSLGALGASVASLAAVADGALLSETPLSVLVVDRAGITPPLPLVPRAVPSRERTHRALAFLRVLGHGMAGSAIALALGLAERGTPQALALLAIAGLVTIAAAESAARAIGDALGENAAHRLRWFTAAAETVLTPVVRMGEWLDAALSEAVSDANATVERREEAAAQFREVITSEADVSVDERDLLLGIFDFGETTAAEVMVPRVDIIGVEQGTPWSEVLDRVRSAQHSRVPVFEDTVDEIIGVLYAKDLLRSVLDDEEPASGWLSLIRPAAFIPASKRIADLLREFRASGRHIAIVADEYGGTAGLVTIEDVLEELVGEIRDEYDHEEGRVRSEEDTRFWVSGGMNLSDLSEALDHDFERDDVTSVGGLILDVLGRVPRAGESLTIGPFRVIVERVVRRKVERVFFERLSEQADGIG